MNRLIKISAVCLVAAMAASCSITKKNANTISGAQATKTETPIPTQPNPVTSIPPATSSTVENTPSATSSISELEQRLGGKWTIIQVGSTTIDRDEDMPYIIFEPSTSMMYASNGCNTLNSAFTLDSQNTISFHNMASTLRACPDVPYETQINSVLSEQPVPFKISEIGSESFFDFLDANGKSIMKMRRGNLEFLNGQWDVESITGVSKLDVPASIFFDIAELKLHGNTGCNIVNGDIYLDHRRPNSVDFSNMMTTRMACPYDKQQTAMLVALEETASALNDGTDKVLLLNGEGKILMTLKKADKVYED